MYTVFQIPKIVKYKIVKLLFKKAIIIFPKLIQSTNKELQVPYNWQIKQIKKIKKLN